MGGWDKPGRLNRRVKAKGINTGNILFMMIN